jgi:uncharacterized protein with GYD domain
MNEIYMVSACVLIRSERGKSGEVVAKVKQFPGVGSAFAALGRYDVVVDLEASDPAALADTVYRMGNLAGVVFTETLTEIQRRG